MGGCNSCKSNYLESHKLTLEDGLFQDPAPKKIPKNALHTQSFTEFLADHLKGEFKGLPITFEPKVSTSLLQRLEAGERVNITGTVASSWKLKVAILTEYGLTTRVLFVDKSVMVSDIEKQIRNSLGQPNIEICLSYRNVRLINDDSLAEYCSPPYTKLVAVSCNTEFSKRFFQINFIVPWKVLTPGLNFEAVCSNNRCCAYEQIVYVHRGRGLFNLEGEQYQSYQCPACKEEVKLLTFGVAWCKYSYILNNDSHLSKSLTGDERTTNYTKLEDITVLNSHYAEVETLKL